MANIILEDKPVGVLGSGSFGTVVAQLLAQNVDVLLYTRRKEIKDAINEGNYHFAKDLPFSIKATSDPAEISGKCTMIFPVVPSASFREVMRTFSPFLQPHHFVIHATKGFDIGSKEEEELVDLEIKDVNTMSNIIAQETAVSRIGCLSGPNLAKEIMQGLPTATVIASKFSEVIKSAQLVLSSSKFHVFGTHDLKGAELAGALKNIIAIGAGIIGGKEMGRNLAGLLISRGLIEMINIGKLMGAHPRPFLGTAGIGDLVATTSSTNSRNYTFGYQLAKGKTYKEVLVGMEEVAEGVRTLKIVKALADKAKIHIPITQILHKIVFDELDIDKAIEFLIRFPYEVDVDFI